jgi:aspartyl-tRNA(Asn)/glutamyl-tRNA(Gln) amidotransferase subunit A
MELKDLTIKKTHEHLKNGDFSATELAEMFLKNATEKNPDLNVYLEIFDDVIEQAKNADERIKTGHHHTLNGIPLSVKDNILIKGKRVGAASKILEGYVATYDATVIQKLKEEGVVFVGRTNMDEFAMGASTENSAYGATKNPLDPSRVPGGSSGGSAASVAGCMALASLGSDTAGSIRQPASFCGIVGLKPTYGSVSRHGLIALGSSLDVIGPLTHTVTDAELVFDAIQGKDRMDATSVNESDFKIGKDTIQTVGVPRAFLEDSGADERVLKNFFTSLEKLKERGYSVQDIELPHISHSVPTYYIVLPAEASSNLARFDGVRFGLHSEGNTLTEDYFKTKGAGFGPEPRRRILIGTYVLSAGYHDAYYIKAVAVRNKISHDFKEAFKQVDVIALPTTAGPAFKIGEKSRDPLQMYLEDIFTVPANHAGLPALTLPSGTVSEEGVELPLGLQLYAPHMHEQRLFQIGKKFLGEE